KRRAVTAMQPTGRSDANAIAPRLRSSPANPSCHSRYSGEYLMLAGPQAAVRIGLATAAKELGSTTSIRISIESNPSRLDAATNDFWPPLWIRTVLLQEGIHPPLETK